MITNLAGFGSASAGKWLAVGLAIVISVVNAAAYAKRAGGSSAALYAKLGLLTIVLTGLGCVAYAAYSSDWRTMAREAGLYDHRQTFQFYATATLLVVPVIAAMLVAWYGNGQDTSICVAAVLAVAILVVELLHAVSFHPVDAFFATKMAPGLSLRAATQAILFLQFNLALLAGHSSLTRTQRLPAQA